MTVSAVSIQITFLHCINAINYFKNVQIFIWISEYKSSTHSGSCFSNSFIITFLPFIPFGRPIVIDQTVFIFDFTLFYCNINFHLLRVTFMSGNYSNICAFIAQLHVHKILLMQDNLETKTKCWRHSADQVMTALAFRVNAFSLE